MLNPWWWQNLRFCSCNTLIMSTNPPFQFLTKPPHLSLSPPPPPPRLRPPLHQQTPSSNLAQPLLFLRSSPCHLHCPASTTSESEKAVSDSFLQIDSDIVFPTSLPSTLCSNFWKYFSKLKIILALASDLGMFMITNCRNLLPLILSSLLFFVVACSVLCVIDWFCTYMLCIVLFMNRVPVSLNQVILNNILSLLMWSHVVIVAICFLPFLSLIYDRYGDLILPRFSNCLR